ncbi:MAG TPA: DUF4175 family protein [Ignavibacteria bacterium]|nr:DUF4175 family protein [Ignavibacteria bacterium]
MSTLQLTAQNTYNEITSRLSAISRKESLYVFANNFLRLLIFSASLLFVILVLESIFSFNSTIRKVLFFGFIAVSIGSLGIILFNFFKSFFQNINSVAYANKLGKYYPDIKDKLSNSLFLYDKAGAIKSNSDELIFENLLQVNDNIKNKNLASFINYKSLRNKFFVLLSVGVIYVLSFAFFGNDLNAAYFRLVNYQYSFINNEYGIYFEVTPGSVEIVKGGEAEIKVTLKSNKPDLKVEEINLTLIEKFADGTEVEKEKRTLTSSGNNVYYTKIENINNPLTYFVSLEDINSSKYFISVSDYPVVKKFFVTITPPAVSGLPQKKLNENEGNIICPEGSQISFYLESNKELSQAGITFNGQFISFNTNGDKANGSITASQNGKYKFTLKDINGTDGKNATEYNITVNSNQPPTVTIIEPQEVNYTIKAQSELLLRARISDDYGFSSLKLNYAISNNNSTAAPKFTSFNIPVTNLNATAVEVPYIWNFPKPGKNQRVEYYLEVTDNTGKTGKSELRTLSYFSASDLLKETEKLTSEIKADLNSIVKSMSDMSQQSQQSRNLMKTNEELGLNDPNQKQQIQEKVENLQNTLQDAQNKIEQSLNELQKTNMLNDKTLEQYMKLQELFNKINTPELQDMLKKIQDALKKNNPQELRDAMKNFNFDEEMFKKNMEKLMDLMKKIESMQKLGELTQKLDDITKQQDELKKETENANQNDPQKLSELANKQQDIKQQTNDFKQKLQEAVDQMKDLQKRGNDDMNPKKFEDLLNKMNKKNTENKMQKSSEQMQNDKNQSEETQEEIMQDLNEMNEEMQQSLDEMLDTQDMSQKMMDKMKDIKSNLEELSKKQQELKEKTQELGNNDKQNFQSKSKDQSGLQKDLSQNIDDLMGMSKDGFQMSPELGKELGNSYNKMDKASEDLQNSKKSDAVGNQGKAKESLDNAAKMLGDMLSEMQQSMSGKSGKDGKSGNGKMNQLMQQLANVIAQQQGLAGQMGQFGQNGKDSKEGQNGKNGKDGKSGKDGYSQEQLQQIDKLRMEQQQIEKSMEQLQREFEEEKQRSGEKLLGDMNEMRKEMNEIIKQMSEYKIDDQLIEKQNRILSRMLDAQLSQREKDFEQKRESKPGNNVVRNTPPEIILSGPNSFNALKEEFLKIQKNGYNEDYELLISKYLLQLKQSGYIDN